MAGNSAPLDDPALDSELEALLAVEPSAGFNARVLAGATAPAKWRTSWLLASAGMLGAAALVVALISDFRTGGLSGPTLTGRPFAELLAHAPMVSASVIDADLLTGTTASSRPAPRKLGRAAPGRPTELVVLVALDESRALSQLLARTRPIQVASATDDSPLPLWAGAPAPVRPLHVPRLAIEPLEPSEDLSGGARP